MKEFCVLCDCNYATVSGLIITANQPRQKECIHGYLFPLPVAVGPAAHQIYDATAGKSLSWLSFKPNIMSELCTYTK